MSDNVHKIDFVILVVIYTNINLHRYLQSIDTKQ